MKKKQPLKTKISISRDYLTLLLHESFILWWESKNGIFKEPTEDDEKEYFLKLKERVKNST